MGHDKLLLERISLFNSGISAYSGGIVPENEFFSSDLCEIKKKKRRGQLNFHSPLT